MDVSSSTLRGLAAALAMLGGTGCALTYPTTIPMKTVNELSEPAHHADTLLVLLPGQGDAPKDFVSHGMLDDVRAMHLPVDVIAADAHLGYYMRSTIVTRLWEDVLAPAKAQGYAHIWLLGISLGGGGALSTMRQHPGVVSGVILLAPYLGDSDLIDGIAEQGGLAAWKPQPTTDVYALIWQWLQKTTAPGAEGPAIYLGYGESDRFLKSDAMLAARLPPTRAAHAPGGHDWDTWRTLWKVLLPRALGTRSVGAK